MRKTKRCSGYKGHWECSDEHPDHQVPVEQFGIVKDGFQSRCGKCKTRYDRIRNPNMPRHPETNQRKMHWLTARAKEYYGGMPKDPKTDKHWKACRDMATKDSESIAWVRPDNSNILQFTPRTWTNKNGELKTTNTVTLKSTVRNDGLPKGIVTPSEKKVRRETKKIKYDKPGWVYALKDHMKQPGYLKIGSSNDLKRRLADFNTAGDFEMMYWRKVPDCKKAEREVHTHFAGHNHIREWFKVSLKDAVEQIDIVADLSVDSDWEGIVDVGEADES